MMSATVSEISEGQLLQQFLPLLEEHNRRAQRLVLGPGDDSSVLDLSAGLTVVSTDTQTQGQDFRCRWPSGYETGGYDVGFKAATQNLADIAAMGAQPVSLLVSMSLPPETPVSWVLDFARGLTDSCKVQGAESCSISGGDLGRSSEISVTVTAVGLVQNKPVLRSGAQATDVLAVAGRLGAAACGLEILETPGELLDGFEGAEECIEWQSRPIGALGYGVEAGNIAHAMMDVSDGLLRDCSRIAQASLVSIDIDRRALDALTEPLYPAARWLAQKAQAGASYTGTSQEAISRYCEELVNRWVLTGGEDHAILATFAPGQLPQGFLPIGTCHPAKDSLVTVNGRIPQELGWDHFSSSAAGD